jgi:hypothetical protein
MTQTSDMSWKKHPTIKNLWCHKSGKKFQILNVVYKAIPVSHIKKEGRTVESYNVGFKGTTYSPYKLTLEAWLGVAPNDGKRWYSRTKDGDRNNINYTNLYWSTSLFKKYSLNNAGQVLSTLSLEDLQKIYKAKEKGATLKDLGTEYNVSPTSIARGLRRYKKTFLI